MHKRNKKKEKHGTKRLKKPEDVIDIHMKWTCRIGIYTLLTLQLWKNNTIQIRENNIALIMIVDKNKSSVEMHSVLLQDFLNFCRMTTSLRPRKLKEPSV